MVISVDTGNKMIKTEHYEFNSGIDVLDTIPGENDEVIEFGGKYYRTTLYIQAMIQKCVNYAVLNRNSYGGRQ